ncbi:MAG: DoxX family protein [Burkholderiales bacterium]|nr:DoxX family protein [Burkholderiales bacterium]
MPVIGRFLLALIFVFSGWGKIAGFAGAASYMAAKGMPWPQVLLPGAILIELGGGLALMLGWKARWAALAIFLFCIPTTLIFHDFWALPPEQAQTQMINFLKNLALMGGLLYVVAFGPGALSVDGSRRRR